MITKNEPVHTVLLLPFPWTVIESDENRTAALKKPTPYCAIGRAWLDENRATTSTKRIGLSNHHGSEPAPPGLPNNTKLVGPPGIDNPGSAKNLAGLAKASNEYGATITNGAIKSVSLL